MPSDDLGESVPDASPARTPADASDAYQIHVRVEDPFAGGVDEPALVSAIRATLQHQCVGQATVTLVIADDPDVQQLNRDFRGIDAPTDVLSFPNDAFADEEELDAAHFVVPSELLEEETTYLGDLIIALPYTQRQAQKQQRDLQSELCLLAIHGTLHLLGFDHASEAEEAEMWAIQNSILTSLGYETVTAP